MTHPETPSPQTTEGLGATPLTAEAEAVLREVVAEEAAAGRRVAAKNAARIFATLDRERDAARQSVPSEALAEAIRTAQPEWPFDQSLAQPSVADAFDAGVNATRAAILAALPKREDAPATVEGLENDLRELWAATPAELAKRLVNRGWGRTANREDAPEPPDVDRLAFAMEARDVQRGGSPHITPGNRFYREQAAALIALMPPLVREDAPSREGLDVEPGHNHTTSGFPTFPVCREACPLGCDALRAGEIAANTGKRPNLAVVDPFVEAAAMQAVRAAAALPNREDAPEGRREAIKRDLTALAHWSREDWQERGRGADPIARTINAARDIVDAHLGGSDGR